jgi:iron(III) transport system ATP-binding protein
MTGALLACRDVRKSFRPGRPVLDGVDLEVPAGTALVLLGTSGAGKTTLLRILAGLEEADAGTVLLGDEVLSDPRVRVPPERRRVGVVFQALELWPQLTVAEHVAFGLPGRPRGRRAARHEQVRALARDVGLDPELLRRRPDTLSGGEQQRVAIARTLAARPEVILYDEPLANLDPARRRSLRALIRRLGRERGTTLVYVTHDPEDALEIGDQVAVLAGAHVVERGAPAEVYAHPTTLAGARALGPIADLPAQARGGRVRTVLGTHAATVPDGPCRVLWRPEGLVALAPGEDVEGSAAVEVDEVVARGPDWSFTGRVEGVALQGRSPRPVTAGETLRVRVDAPAAVVPAAGERTLEEVPA